jgi:nucleotide-binding universal stress UspA family protein
MPTFLVPLDGSSFAERALRPAAALAARHDGGGTPGRVLLLACTWPEDPPVQPRLDDRAALLGDVVDVDVRVLDGVQPAEGILQTLAVVPDAVLCMATHGRGGLRAAVLGSVAEDVLCRADTPVLLVGPGVQGTVLPGERGRMIVTSDGSPVAETVLPHAARWARDHRMQPWLVEVIGPDEGVHPPGQPSVIELRQEAERRLERLVSRLDDAGQPVRTEVLHGLPASRSINGFAADLPASLIVMASHGRSGLLRTALGSVAGEVVRHAPCPVLVHRPSSLAP